MRGIRHGRDLAVGGADAMPSKAQQQLQSGFLVVQCDSCDWVTCSSQEPRVDAVPLPQYMLTEVEADGLCATHTHVTTHHTHVTCTSSSESDTVTPGNRHASNLTRLITQIPRALGKDHDRSQPVYNLNVSVGTALEYKCITCCHTKSCTIHIIAWVYQGRAEAELGAAVVLHCDIANAIVCARLLNTSVLQCKIQKAGRCTSGTFACSHAVDITA